MKRKTQRMGARTAILHSDGYIEVMGGKMVHVRAEAARTLGARAVLLVEADPLADAVVRRALAWWKDSKAARPFWDAVEALDAKRPKK